MHWSYGKYYYTTVNISGMGKCCTSGKYILWPWLTLGLLNHGCFVQLFTQSHDVRSFLLNPSRESFGIAKLSNTPPDSRTFPLWRGSSVQPGWKLTGGCTGSSATSFRKWSYQILSSWPSNSALSGDLSWFQEHYEPCLCLSAKVTKSMCPTNTFSEQREICCTETFYL